MTYINSFSGEGVRISRDELFWLIAQGKAPLFSRYIPCGRKIGVSTTVMSDLTQIPNVDTIPYPNGIQLRIVSDSANDTSNGTGIRTLRIVYLDVNYDIQNEIIIMNGLTPVNTIATNIQRIYWMSTITAGANGVAVGNISLQNLAGTITYEYIKASENKSLTCHFTIPKDTTGYVLAWQVSGKKQTMSIRFRAAADPYTGELTPGIFTFRSIVDLYDSASGLLTPLIPGKFLAKTDLKISAIGDVGGGDAAGTFQMVCIRNS